MEVVEVLPFIEFCLQIDIAFVAEQGLGLTAMSAACHIACTMTSFIEVGLWTV